MKILFFPGLKNETRCVFSAKFRLVPSMIIFLVVYPINPSVKSRQKGSFYFPAKTVEGTLGRYPWVAADQKGNSTPLILPDNLNFIAVCRTQYLV